MDAGVFQSMVESSAGAALLVTAAGDILYSNPSCDALLGPRAQRTNFFTLLGPDDEAKLRSLWQSCLLGQAPQHDELQYLHVDGSTRTAETTLSPCQPPDTLFVELWDLTSRQHNAEVHKRDAINLFASGMAHKLNNALTTIMGFTEILKQDLGTPQLDDLAEIIGASQRIGDLSEKLSVLGGYRVNKPERASLSAQLRRCLHMTQPQLPKAVEISLQLDEAVPLTYIDSSQLELLLLAMLNNAAEAMPSGGKLEILTHAEQVSTPGGHVVLTLRDSGAGIRQDQLPFIFDPFFTTKRNADGLGLALVYGIVKKHSGRIRVESRVGVGTTFWLYFPQASLGARP